MRVPAALDGPAAAPAPVPVADRLGYRPALDGLRGLSIAGVMLSHFIPRFPWARPAQLGVDVFFVLSGFLITTLLLEEEAAAGRLALGRFYKRRAARLLPALGLMLLVVVPVGYFLWPSERQQLALSAASALLYVSNWVMIVDHRSFWIMPQVWSLAVEEQFYLLWPPLLSLALKRVADRRLLALGMGLLFSAFVLWRVHLLFSGASASHLLYGSDVRADELLAGCLAAGLRSWRLLPAGLREPSWAQGWGAALAALALASLVWPNHLHMETWGRPAFAACTAVLILSVVQGQGALRDLLSAKPLVGLGRISYGLYLWHVPLFAALWLWDPDAGWAAVGAGVVGSLAIAGLSFRFVERPAQRWSHREV